LPKQLKEHGLGPKAIKIGPAMFKTMLEEYTREAGVRTLERTIATVCRKVAREMVEKQSRGRKSITITPKNMRQFLGVVPFPANEKLGKDEVGVATGLAWTEFGGETLSIEVALLKGGGRSC